MTQADQLILCRDFAARTVHVASRAAFVPWAALVLLAAGCAAEGSSQDARELAPSNVLPQAGAGQAGMGALSGSGAAGMMAPPTVVPTPGNGQTPAAPPVAPTPIDMTPVAPPTDPGGTAGMAAPLPTTPPPPPTTPVTPTELCPPTGDASEVAMIGDSYLALNGQTTRTLEGLTGRTYRHYYVSGTQLVGGFPPNIPSQYQSAIGDGPIQTLIMNGGGNDVILGNPACRSQGPSACEGTVAAAVSKLEEMLAQMATDGVKDVIYFFYPHLPNANLSAVVDYALPLVRGALERCAPDLRCHFIDTVPAFEGKNYISFDGIHPTSAGSAVIGELIYDVLEQDACIFR